ncbi:hypothetical protein [Acinetobacter baumannii]|uniref:hypothetical protein n=1 Tax=Acinetobacter baumannii TaxID=470 RepID=UPI000D64B558|nr:hypothetical protein [Acinetobacter baumannii]MDV7566197.1 hypothetical protein [Acinetobacter baumannii]MDX7940667.1 hypothetical protein [Acinetobacter baumannii]MDX7944144.1 hypothetical protein [Acinetobacter baumannii]NLH05189.1 hypothetical protein [Acinetobacter baumannii]
MQAYDKAFMKTVTASDIDASVSNQHELHGVSKLQEIFGKILSNDDTKYRYQATIRTGHSGKPEPISITWYNARANHPSRQEYRLYYVASGAHLIRQLSIGDDIFIGKTKNDAIEIVIFPSKNSGYSSWTSIPIP